MSGYAVPIYLPRRRRIITPGEWLRDKLDEQRRAREAEIALAIAVDQGSIGTPVAQAANATTVVLTTNTVVASSGFIVIAASCDPAQTLSSVASSPALTWTIDKQATQATSGDTVGIASAQAPSGFASGSTITVTYTAGVIARQIAGSSFTGIATSSPVDGTPITASQATTAWSSGNYVTSGAALVFAASETDTSTSNTTTAPSLEVFDFQEPSAGNTLCGEYRIDGSAGTRTVVGTWGLAANGISVTVAYKAAAGAAFIAPQERRAMQAVQRSNVW